MAPSSGRLSPAAHGRVATREPRGMLTFLAALLLVGCGDGDGAGDAGSDAGGDGDSDAGCDPGADADAEVDVDSADTGGLEAIPDGPADALAVGWTHRPSSDPSPLFGPMAFDERQDAVVRFNAVGSASFVDAWTWDRASAKWTLHPPAGEAPRTANGTAYESDRFRSLVCSSTPGPLAGLWEWDDMDRRWQHLSSSLGCTGHDIVYDAGRQAAVLFYGGLVTAPPARVMEWSWDTGTSVDRTPSPLPAAWPAARGGQTMVFDAGRRRVWIFGGSWMAGTTFHDIWEWDGDTGTWVDRTPSPLPAAWPAARSGAAAAYDERRKRIMLFGGRDAAGASLDDLWEWDGDTGTFTGLTPDPRPSVWPTPGPSDALEMVWDAMTGHSIVALGGAMWEWRGPP